MRCHTFLVGAAAALAAFPAIASAFAPPTPRRQAIVRQCSPPHAVVRAHTPRSSTARRLLPTTTSSSSSSSVNNAVPTPAAADEVAAGSSAAAATDATTLDADAAPIPAVPAHSGLSSSFLLLNAVAVIWGSQHVVIKTSLETLPPSALNLGRFATSCVLFLPAISTVLVRLLHFSCCRHPLDIPRPLGNRVCTRRRRRLATSKRSARVPSSGCGRRWGSRSSPSGC